MATSVKEMVWLEWIAGLMGAASRRRHSAVLPPQQFHCLLDELPLHLIPRRNFNRKRCRQDLSQALFLNPECQVLPAGELPPDLQAARDLLERFNLHATTAWVRDPATGSIDPFWCQRQYQKRSGSCLRRLA
jgi:hypothetical protein